MFSLFKRISTHIDGGQKRTVGVFINHSINTMVLQQRGYMKIAHGIFKRGRFELLNAKVLELPHYLLGIFKEDLATFRLDVLEQTNDNFIEVMKEFEANSDKFPEETQDYVKATLDYFTNIFANPEDEVNRPELFFLGRIMESQTFTSYVFGAEAENGQRTFIVDTYIKSRKGQFVMFKTDKYQFIPSEVTEINAYIEKAGGK